MAEGARGAASGEVRHDHGAHAVRAAGHGHEQQLLLVLVLTAAYTCAEVGGGLWTGSLALIADAGHMFTDVLGLALAVAAIRFSRRPATSDKTYGFYRLEILSALANGVLLLLVAVSILLEAVQRLRDPQSVQAFPMLLVASGGLLVTGVGVSLLHGGAAANLNVRGAFLEVLGDLLGAAGTIVAAILILLLGWNTADPIASIVIGLLILPRSWTQLRSVVDVLLEAVPDSMNLSHIQAVMGSVPGVVSVHDLHVWSISSGFVAMSGHVRSSGRRSSDVLHDVRRLLHDEFGIEHLTLQVEPDDHADDGACCIVDPRCLVLGEAAVIATAALRDVPEVPALAT